MRIVIAIDHFKEGGAERVASILANQLSKNHDVHVVVMEDRVNYPLDKTRINYHVVDFIQESRFLRKVTKLVNYRKILIRINPEVVFAFANYMSIYTYVSLLGKRTKTIFSERTDPTKEPKNIISRSLRDFAYSHANVLVCQTEWVKQYFETKLKTNCVVIPNPITPNLPSWEGIRSTQILTACRLTAQKNLPLLLRAFARIHKEYPDFTLKILGEGEDRKKLEVLIRELKLDYYVFMPGFSKDVYKEMVNSYLYVSSSDYEGISNSMIEALGCGLPTICTDCPVGGASMFIKDGVNGLLVPVGDELSLYSSMKRLINSSDLAFCISSNSKEINNILNVDNITSMWIKTI